MDIVTIFQTLFRWGVPALAGGIILLLVLAGGYLFYKKVLHGEKRSADCRQPVQRCCLAG